MTARRPPRLAERLLTATLPESLADDVLATLEDLHAARVFRHGTLRADLWFWRQSLWFPVRLWLAGNDASHVPSTTKGTSPMRALAQDLGYAWRLYRGRPGFTLAAVLSLAVAIGFNTAIFSAVDTVLLRPAPLPDFDRLVMVWETDRMTGTTREPGSVPDFIDYRTDARSLESLGAMIAREANLTMPGRDPSRLAGLAVTPDLTPLLGLRPLAGRLIADDDARLNRNVVVISDSLWNRLFDRRPDALGRMLSLDETPFEIVGVVPDTTDFGVLQVLSAAAYARSFADRGLAMRVDIWTPLVPDPDSLPRSTHPALMIGRLAPGVHLTQAQDELTRLAADLEAAYPNDNDGRGVNVESMSDVVFGPVRPAFLALLGAVGLVLLVACANVVNLLLAQGEARRREVAIRVALGAGRARLARQFLVEALLLTLVAGGLGIAMAYAGLGWLVSLAPADVPRLVTATIDGRVLLVALAASSLIGIAFGVVPTLQAARVNPGATFGTDATRSATGGRRRARGRAVVVVTELALAVMLVSGAGLLIKSFWKLQGVDPGFDAPDVVKAEYQLPAARYPADFSVWPDFKEQHAFTRTLLDRAARLPGARSVAIAGNHPLDPGFTNSFSVVGREAEAREWPEITIRRVTAGYFETVGLQLIEGRSFDSRDTTASAPVVLINVAARERFFPDGAATGHEIRLWGANRQVVGIVANEKFQGLTAQAPIALYAPLWQTPSSNGAGVLLVRTDGGQDAALSALPRVIGEIDPALAVIGVEPLTETVSRSASTRRFTMTLVSLFAAMAFGLAALGVHGVLSYNVSQRRREIGIRVALGARPDRVRRLVVRQALLLSGAGLALGLAGGLVLSRLFASLLFDVTPGDPQTYFLVAGGLLAMAWLASYVPARAASRVDPATALRID